MAILPTTIYRQERKNLGRSKKQMWTFLHFLSHALLILLPEGSLILALMLDVSFRDLKDDAMLAACEGRRAGLIATINLLNSTIADMEINYSSGVLQEKFSIGNMLWSLRNNLAVCTIGYMLPAC